MNKRNIARKNWPYQRADVSLRSLDNRIRVQLNRWEKYQRNIYYIELHKTNGSK